MTSLTDAPMSELVTMFESIGNNCEFGIVQRHHAYDPPGLFRNVGFLNPDSIINAIDSNLDQMFDAEKFEFVLPEGWPDWRLDCQIHGFGFHTAIPASIERGSPEWLKKTEQSVAAFRFLKRRFQTDLLSGEKTFIFRFIDELPASVIERLYQAIRKHGPGWLLYVKQDRQKTSALVETIHNGLLVSSITKLSNENPPQIDFAAWGSIMSQASQLRSSTNKMPKPLETKSSNQYSCHSIQPLRPNLEIIPHLLSSATSTGEPLSHIVIQGLETDQLYKFELWVFLPSDFSGSDISVLMWGVYSEAFDSIDINSRDTWQYLSVSARTSVETTSLVPSLVASGVGCSTFYSSGWTFSKVHNHPRQLAIRPLEQIELGLRDESNLKNVIVSRLLPDNKPLEIPAIEFGQINEPDFPIQQYPSNNWSVTRDYLGKPTQYILRNAVIHGNQGLIEFNGMAVEESLRLIDFDNSPIFSRTMTNVAVQNRTPNIKLSRGMHAFSGYPGNHNYAHWLIDLMPIIISHETSHIFENETFFWPELKYQWQIDSLSLFPEILSRSVFFSEQTIAQVGELIVGPHSLKDPGHFPGPSISEFANITKKRLNLQGASGNRKLYISRRDTKARQLVNEDEIIILLDSLGFEILNLSELSFARQVDKFAEAKVIVGGHGAGLANIIFCNEHTNFLELFADGYVQWSMRRLASLKSLRYGCLVGHPIGSTDSQQAISWTLDIQKFKEVINEII
jgi:hypothetical protein